MGELSDNNLVEMRCRGDKQAYASLVSRYSERVFAISLGILGNTHDAEDFAQEALLKGFSRMNSLRENEQFAPWIAMIARNLCIDFLRRKKRERAVLAQQDPPDRAVKDENPHLRKAIGRLSQTHRLPLLLYYFDGRSVKGVAETLSITQSAVLSRLCRARRELRTILAGPGGES